MLSYWEAWISCWSVVNACANRLGAGTGGLGGVGVGTLGLVVPLPPSKPSPISNSNAIWLLEQDLSGCDDLVMGSTGTASVSHSDQDGKIEVWFRFVPREGWLPYDTEGLWAVRLSDDTARIENVPFLQDGIAQGEIVRFVTDDEGLHWATGRVEASGNCTIRVISIPSGPLGQSAAAVHERLSAFGLGGEVFSQDFPLVAFNVPAGSDLAGIKRLLVQGQDEGWWHFEVACMTHAWQTA